MNIKEVIRRELFVRLSELPYLYSASYPSEVVYPSIILDEVQGVGRETFYLYFHLFSDLQGSDKEVLDIQEALDVALEGFSVPGKKLLSFKYMGGREFKEIKDTKTVRHHTADYELRCF